MKSLVKILLIEDDEDDALLTREYLSEIENFRFDITWESDLRLARETVLKADYDLFLVDYRLGSENGLELIKFMREKNVFTPAIVLTGQGDRKVDVDASQSGAADYLVKAELSAYVLERSIRYALSQSKTIRELNEQEKKYRSLFEHSIDPIFLATEKFQLMDLNHSFSKLFGYTAADSIGLEKLFQNQDDYAYVISTLKEVEQIRDFEVTLISNAGESKICLLNCVFIPDQSSEFCCYQGIIHDLTMRKKAEDDMLIAERLSLTGKIARTIAHEVRNPLTNLNLALDQLKNEIEMGESAQLYGEIIERNVNRIEQLVGEMLHSSKPKELHLQLHPVHEVLEDTLNLALDRIKLRQIQLDKQYDEELPRIYVDKEKIQIALLNIVINALEAMEPGKGVLTIRAKLHEDKVVDVLISDNGKGISEEGKKKLFDPFFTDKKSGMGLGLTTTKNIIQCHSAVIEVDSRIGEGTTFKIQFKLA